jgi:hypothetical protein
MSDIYCRICREPWDSWEVNHDFDPIERDVFKKGKGCPSCKGILPNGQDPDVLLFLASMDEADDTGQDAMEALEHLE